MSDRKGRVGTGRLAILVLFALDMLAGGCGPSITPSSIPTPQVIVLQVTSTLLPLRPLFKTCTEAQENSGLILAESPTPAIDIEQGGLAIRWGLDTPQNGFAAVLGYEELAVVVHPQNPLQQLSLADLQAIYAGAFKNWPEAGPGVPIQPWDYPGGEDIQAIFSHALQIGSPPARSAAARAPDPRAMLEAVAASPAAIGYLPRRWLTSQVKEIPIQGLDRVSLRHPILALTKSEPKGLIKNWLLCVQDGLVE